ncbi:putative polyketide synthase [Podospora conica]|nr:putative polyketide synthase [Schizothecium conicum]
MADPQPPLMPIAIVGMSCRLPGNVSNPNEFYRMLCRKRTGWSAVPEDRFNADAYTHPNPDKKGTFNSAGGYFIKDDISQFDAAFFDITKQEANSMDPAQRLLLETAYEALENSGIPKESICGKKVGVFVGGNYGEHRGSHMRDLDHMPAFDATGNQAAFLAGRLAYYFNLRGPTMHALHLGVQSMRAGECDQAIIGASHLITQPDVWVSMAKLRLFSDSGKTHAFDHRAKSGYARGEGAGCLVLKPLHQAEADNDHIYSVIEHSGISHNGRTVGIVAPSPDEQERLIRDVFAQARIDPGDVGFFEAHGTGTKKGDPIEATAIHRAVGKHFSPANPLYIGSTKPNVGHLECASGIVSVIKSVLMLYYGFILPNADFEKVNDAIPLKEWNMRVAEEQVPWPSRKNGSNSMCVLRAPPTGRGVEIGDHGEYTTERLFVLSANDEPALRASMSKLGIWLEQHAELYQTTMPRNLSYTLCQRRSHLPWRVAIVAGMCGEVAGALNSPDVVPARAPSEPPKLAFVFTGQGAQWHAMGRELLRTHPVFRDAIERCDRALDEIGADFTILQELTRSKEETRVGQAHISQAICTAVQLALVDLLASFGVKPTAVTGHSSGEIGAAYAAGAMSFEGAMAAAYFRGQAIVRLKQQHAGLRGGMMAVGSGAAELGPMLKTLCERGGAQVVVACENSPSSTTLSGDEEGIDEIAKTCQAKGIFNRKLFVDVAYHSPHMKLVAAYYLDSVSHIKPPQGLTSSKVEYYSSLHGRKIRLSELTPSYWVNNLTQAVLFSTSLQDLCKKHNPDIIIEVGPHAALKGPIMQVLKKVGGSASKIAYLPTLLRDQNATRSMLGLVGQLFVRGHAGLNFHNANHNREEQEKPDLVAGLYSYPWTRQKYWHESRISRQHRHKPFARHDLLGTLADWFSALEPTWRNIVRTDDLPWLKEFQVNGRMVFPVAAFMSMTIEAANQRRLMKGLEEAARCEIKDLVVAEHLFFDDDAEIEMLLNLRPVGGLENADEFRISSYEPTEAPRHRLTATPQPPPPVLKVTNPSPTEESSSDTISSCSKDVATSATSLGDAATDTNNSSARSGRPAGKAKVTKDNAEDDLTSGDVYNVFKDIGVSYPQAFRCIDEMSTTANQVMIKGSTRDTKAGMPMGHETAYKMHPSILETMLHEGNEMCAHLPYSIRHFTQNMRWRKHAKFSATSTVETRAETFMVELFSPPASESPTLSMAGVEMRPVRVPTAPQAPPRELCYQFEWQAAKKPDPNWAKTPQAKARIVIASEAEEPYMDGLVRTLARLVLDETGIRPVISSLHAIKDWASNFIVVQHPTRPFLSTLTTFELKQVKALLTTSPGLLWVTRGALRFATKPHGNMALGLVRTARSERAAVAATLDFASHEQLDTMVQAKIVFEAFKLSVMAPDAEDADMEFAEENGELLVPRIVADKELNLEVQRNLGGAAPYRQYFLQINRKMQLAVPARGLLEELYFEESADEPLGDGEVEIAVVASTVSRDDIAFVENEVPKRRISRGCSGTITRVGRNVHDLCVGSRVCALVEGPLTSHARARASSTVEITGMLRHEEAASIPVAAAAAYHALVDIAGVEPGERVLIQFSGPVGVAAGEVARHLGASAYALVGSDKERNAARAMSIARNRILDARSVYARRDLDAATDGEGIEVILAASGSERSRAWDCLADFGRFVEVRASEGHQSTRPELGSNATFTSINMASLAAARPHIMKQTLKAVVGNIGVGSMQPSNNACVFPVSQLARALNKVRAGAVHPVVVTAAAGDQVMATHKASKDIFQPDGTHMIVGGTGGLGRSMAKYMVEHGARYIVLLSRSGGGKDMVEQLKREIRCPEATIEVVKCDVADETQVWQLVSDLATKSMPPVCGVIQAAMVLRDVLLEQMSHADYMQVILPKVQGTWNVHKVLRGSSINLKYFVLLSSASGILGSRGQGAYAAANTFLDSFAQFRAAKGLPAKVLNLTAVTGAGYLADSADAGRQADIIRNFGNETISEQEVLALLSAAVLGVGPQQCLTGMKLRMSGGEWPYYARDGRFSELKAEWVAEAEREGLVPKQSVSAGHAFRAAGTDEEAGVIASSGVMDKLSEVLNIAVDNLDAARDITSYGLDSLTAIELRNWIAKEFRVNLQILELLASGSVNDLAIRIVARAKEAS